MTTDTGESIHTALVIFINITFDCQDGFQP
jgi:hypothetical protein